MDGKTLRDLYFKFFKGKGHKIIPSASLYPENDPSALFISAGMHPLVPYLIGETHPLGTRLVDVQKCVRTGDINEVGDRTHLTFFEMLGNWSLGDYGKEEAIRWSYEFLTDKKWLNLNPDKLSVTVFQGDDNIPVDEESATIWKSLGVPKERIFYLSKKDNLWGPVGDTGPCGPDTEMFFDVDLPKCSEECQPGCPCGKYVEVWNNVFMFYEKQPDGSYKELEQKNIDTGMGLERMLTVLEKVNNVFDTSRFVPLMKKIKELSEITEISADQITLVRIITDHVRSAIFMLSDPKQFVPSNLEQGYVIRRLIRRSIVKGREIGINENFVTKLVDPVLEIFSNEYKELESNKQFILKQLHEEEVRFSRTLQKGLRKFQQILDRTQKISGEDAFMLFSSYGFPVEMTVELVEKKELNINMNEFKAAFKHHQELSRTAAKGRFQSGLSDHSEITTRLHTATHLMHQSLRNVLGDKVQQKGSNITSERTRFDFNFNRKLTSEEIVEVERLVNEAISKDLEVQKEIMTPDEAKKVGALGFFGDVYGEKVSVFNIGNFSKEICTGPHVKCTGEIGRFKITKQKKIGATTIRLRGIIKELEEKE